MTRSTIVVVAAAVLVLSGCRKNTVNQVYQDDFERLAPSVLPGDVLQWDKPIKWLGATTPCEQPAFNDSGKKTCTVTSDARKKRFKYVCESVDCDPEIVVDEIRINSAPAPVSAGAAGTLRTVTLWCTTAETSGKTTVEPSTQSARPGERIGWATIDDYKLADDWKVALQGDDKGKVCVGGKDTFSAGDNKCTVAADAPETVTYNVTSSRCTQGMGTITTR